MAAPEDGKWRVTATDVTPASIDKVWAILAEFDGFKKNYPNIFTSADIIEGGDNKVGSVRALALPTPDGGTLEVTERLLHLDNVNHTLTYNIEKCNQGWTGYLGHISVKSLEDGQTHMSWGCEVDPIKGETKETFFPKQKAFFTVVLQTVKELVSN